MTPQVRKRAVLALFKVFEKYPEALRTGFGRLREKLEDEDPGESGAVSPGSLLLSNAAAGAKQEGRGEVESRRAIQARFG